MINLNALRMMRMVRMSMKMSVTDMIDMSIMTSMNMCVHGGQTTGRNGIHQHATIPPERSEKENGTVPFNLMMFLRIISHYGLMSLDTNIIIFALSNFVKSLEKSLCLTLHNKQKKVILKTLLLSVNILEVLGPKKKGCTF